MSLLAPRFRAAIESVIAEMKQQGYDPIVFETYRKPERQQYLHGFGRLYDDGRGVVTHASTTQWTWHGYGLAVDIISYAREWDAPQKFWDALAVAAHNAGLAWGGKWPLGKRDLPHVQWGEPMRVTPSEEAADLKAKGGDAAVWAEVNAA